ncbi:MAG: response regulator [Bacteroidetes bacterium]|nr:response regulator [Bacteroidota bacterium]
MKKIFALLLYLVSIQAHAQDSVRTLHAADLKTSAYIHLDNVPWLFYAGRLPGERPMLSTTGWRTIPRVDFSNANTPPGWTGIGWFAIRVKADSTLAGKRLAFQINHDGASEIFLDEKLIGGYGRLGNSAREMEAMSPPRKLLPLWLPDTLPHLISIHYANHIGVFPDFIGFQPAIGYYEVNFERQERAVKRISSLLLFSGAHFILCFLFFSLFLFYPRQKLNLYFSLFVALTGMILLMTYMYSLTTSASVQYWTEIVSALCRTLLIWSGSLMLYAVGYERVPRVRMIIVSAVTLYYIVHYSIRYFDFSLWYREDYFSWVFVLFTLDGCWSAYRAIRRRTHGAWLIATGMAAVCLVYFFIWGDILGVWPQSLNSIRLLLMGAGMTIFPACFSLYLALDFARTNQLLAGEARRLEEAVRQRTEEVQRQADRLREMDAVKSRFFANISHEFKTPLALIINPAEELLRTNDPGVVKRLAGYIQRNARRLLTLINQLLDLNKLESGSMEIQAAPLELVAFIRNLVRSFEYMVMQKGLQLHFTSPEETCWVSGDADKLEKIVQNLLSNAVKFTDQGSVTVTLEKNEKGLLITVKDTGKGIAAAKLPYIFDRFYQADPSDTRFAEGTGIGLALSRELVQLMGGAMQAESIEGVSTEIRVELPYQPAVPQPVTEIQEQVIPHSIEWQLPEPTVTDAPEDSDKPLVLIIEDNDELRSFLQHSLSGAWRILTASGGQEGVGIATEEVPNLVITDLMMPGTDGYTVCRTLKNDERTSHIPILMLTAKTGTDNRVQGIQTGADAYLGKPFEHRELLALVQNLIETRRRLRERYSLHSNQEETTGSEPLPPIEKAFMDRVRQSIENHLGDVQYGTDQLAADMHLSRTQLHRKMKDLIGQAPGELIRITRLERARTLLQQRTGTVSEVAYEVGFSSPASFSASFSRHFGYPPSTV